MGITKAKKGLLVLVLPAVAFIVAMVGYPLVYNFILSFSKASLFNIARGHTPFVGLDNYISVISKSEFVPIMYNTFLFTIGSIVFQYIFGLFLALYFDQDFPLSNFLRGLLVLGWILPPIVVATTWRWMMNTQSGLINHLLMSIGLISEPIPWLVSSNMALPAVILANIWFGIPFNVIILSAALSDIPTSVYEAAALDGAIGPSRLFYITLPLIKGTSLALLMLGFILGFKLFDLVWVMTGGGPVFATTLLSIWAYRFSFEFFEFGLGTAVTAISFVLVFLLAYVYVRGTVREETRA